MLSAADLTAMRSTIAGTFANVTRRRWTVSTDAYNEEVRNAPTDTTITGRIGPLSVDEEERDRSSASTDLQFTTAHDTDLLATDQLVYASVVYEVIGPPRFHGSGFELQKRYRIRVVTGA